MTIGSWTYVINIKELYHNRPECFDLSLSFISELRTFFTPNLENFSVVIQRNNCVVENFKTILAY